MFCFLPSYEIAILMTSQVLSGHEQFMTGKSCSFVPIATFRLVEKDNNHTQRQSHQNKSENPLSVNNNWRVARYQKMAECWPHSTEDLERRARRTA